MGQLGVGDKKNRNSPVKIPGLTDITNLPRGYGYRHTIVKDFNDTIWVFGRNDHGQLGIGDHKQCLVPNPMDHKYSHIIRYPERNSNAKSARK